MSCSDFCVEKVKKQSRFNIFWNIGWATVGQLTETYIWNKKFLYLSSLCLLFCPPLSWFLFLFFCPFFFLGWVILETAFSIYTCIVLLSSSIRNSWLFSTYSEANTNDVQKYEKTCIYIWTKKVTSL